MDNYPFIIKKGTAAGDFLIGTPLENEIFGMDGNDLIMGNGRTDMLHGDGGNDSLYGGGGNDQLNGGANDDNLYGEADNDQLWGDAGADKLVGGSGSDRFNGGSGIDTYDFTDTEKVTDTLIITLDNLDLKVPTTEKLTGFSSGEDKIDLRHLGLNKATSEAGFTSGKGPITFDGDFVKIDYDSNGTIDLKIELVSVNAMAISDFMFGTF